MRKEHALLIAFAIIAFSTLAGAEPPSAKESKARRTPTSIETGSITDPDLPEETHQLSSAELDRLRVEWMKPTFKKDRHGPQLEIHGRLTLAAENGKSLKPVEWLQPIRVLLARVPEKKVDWSYFHVSESTARADIIIGHEPRGTTEVLLDDNGKPIHQKEKVIGEFTARFSLDQIQRSVGKSKSFQVGICLGKKIGKSVSWTNVAPVLPQSVSTVAINGPGPLSETLQLINGCPTPMGWDYDPAAAVRAANHLRRLGKEKAVAALREFLSVAYDPGYSGYRLVEPANIDTSNQWCLATLIPLVFEAATANTEEPPWFRERITIHDGIPFHNVLISGTSGWPGNTGPLVDWAEKNGRVIDGILRPTSRPLEAADAAFEKLANANDREANGRRFGLREHLRSQAWRMIQAVVDPKDREIRISIDGPLSSQEKWAELKEKTHQLEISWNEVRQEYSASKK
jgi:hypothetical protein